VTRSISSTVARTREHLRQGGRIKCFDSLTAAKKLGIRVVSIRVDENEKVLYDRFASVLDPPLDC
jgi:hypothetical protein